MDSQAIGYNTGRCILLLAALYKINTVTSLTIGILKLYVAQAP